MVFGHNPFIWTPVQVIKNAETVSGNLVLGVWPLDDIAEGIEAVVDAIIPDTFKDEISDKLKKLKTTVDKVSGWAKGQWEYLTGSDEIIEAHTIEWCCPTGGQRRRVLYGKYRVSEDSSPKGGPRTIDGVQWKAGDEYIKAFMEDANGVTYHNGRENLSWTTTNSLPRMYSNETTGGKKEASFSAPPFGAPPRTVDEKVDGVATGNTQQVAALTIQQLVDNFIESGDSIGPGCETSGQVTGCMNPNAENYNSNANCPDGSCSCGFDSNGKRRKFDDSGKCYTVPCHDQGEGRTKHDDGSCSSCKSGFVFKKGVYPQVCVPAPVDCKVSAYTPYSDCSADGKKTRTRTITVQPAHDGQSCGRKYGGKFDPLTGTYSPPVLSQTVACTYTPPPANGGTGGRSANGDEPEACDDGNRETKTDGSCDTDCKDGYEFDDDDVCIEISEEKEGLPMGWILGGVAVALGAFVMMQKK